MGTNFYWIKSVQNEQPLDWQEKFRERIESLEDKTSDNLSRELQNFVKENVKKINEQEEEAERNRHIGKRSAAGLFCWDCNQTFCRDGVEAIHQGRSHWYDACPKCKKEFKREEEKESTSMIELRFSSPKEERPKGVKHCCSFSWALEPQDVYRKCNDNADNIIVEDEYGQQMTGKEFWEMLENNCPVRFTKWIGHEFC